VTAFNNINFRRFSAFDHCFCLRNVFHIIQGHIRTPLKATSRDSTPNGHRSFSAFSNGRGRSSSPLPSRAGDRLLSSSTPVVKKLFEGSPTNDSAGNNNPSHQFLM